MRQCHVALPHRLFDGPGGPEIPTHRGRTLVVRALVVRALGSEQDHAHAALGVGRELGNIKTDHMRNSGASNPHRESVKGKSTPPFFEHRPLAYLADLILTTLCDERCMVPHF